MQNATLLINLIAELIYATKVHFDQRLVSFYMMFRREFPFPHELVGSEYFDAF